MVGRGQWTKGGHAWESPAFCYDSSTGERESKMVRLPRKVEMSSRVFIPSSELKLL